MRICHVMPVTRTLVNNIPILQLDKDNFLRMVVQNVIFEYSINKAYKVLKKMRIM